MCKLTKKTLKCFYSDFNISTLFPFSVYKMPNKKKRVKSFGWAEVNRDKNKKQINEEKKYNDRNIEGD